MEKDLIEYIAKSLVDDPGAVSVTETEGDRGTILQLKVADGDIGKVIGKYGRIAKALRTVLSASAVKDGRRYSLEILDQDAVVLEQMIVGFVRGSHGLSGEFKVESASGEYEHIEVLKEVTLRHNGDQKNCKVEYAEAGNGTLYMKLAEINSPEEVRKYNGWEIVVPRKYAAPLQEGEWYIEDLKQCSLIYYGENKDGLAEGSAPAETVGTVTDVLEGGGGYLLEVSLSENCNILADNIKYDASGKIRSVLIPFRKQYLGKIDVEKQEIVLMHLWILE